MSKNKIISSESISQVIQSVMNGIENGIKDTNFSANTEVEFELTLTADVGAKGEINLKVASAQDHNKQQNVQKVKFKVYFPTSIGGTIYTE